MLSTAATGVSAEVILEALDAVGITHVVIVPDTHQRSVLERLEHSGPPVIRCATEADVMGVCAGLWMTGARPLVMIQQLGIYAGANSLRAFSNEHRVPLAMLIGLYAREVDYQRGYVRSLQLQGRVDDAIRYLSRLEPPGLS